MADNYLEKRMEDLRSGRLNAQGHASKRVTAPSRTGYLSIPFPERRVLTLGNSDGTGEAIATAFRKAGCKSALFDSDKTSGERLAHDEGIRYHNTDINDPENLQKSLRNLLDAWRDIDIAVCLDNEACGKEALSTLRDVIDEWRGRLPFPNPYGGRLVIVARNFSDESGENDDILSKYGFTTNHIMVKDPGSMDLGNLARLCLFLCAPGNECINGAVIPCYSPDANNQK